MPEVCDGATAGTIGRGLAIEALSMRVASGPPGCSVSYRTNIAERGWQNTVRDGRVQGVTGAHDHMLAVRMALSPECF